ncbi:MAG: hypothetical protein WB952_22905 [Terriglobales bacterium]
MAPRDTVGGQRIAIKYAGDSQAIAPRHELFWLSDADGERECCALWDQVQNGLPNNPSDGTWA